MSVNMPPKMEEPENPERKNALLTTGLREQLLNTREFADDPATKGRFRQRIRERLYHTILDFGLLQNLHPDNYEPVFERSDPGSDEFQESFYQALIDLQSVLFMAHFERPGTHLLHTGDGIRQALIQTAFLFDNDHFFVDVECYYQTESYSDEELYELYESGELEDELAKYPRSDGAYELALLYLLKRGFDINISRESD